MNNNSNPLHHILKNTKEHFLNLQTKIGILKKARSKTEMKDEMGEDVATEPSQKIIVEISAISMARSAFVILLLILSFYFLFQISSILVIFFVAFLFSAALDPIIDIFQTWRIPRSIGVLLIYLFIFFILGFLISNLVPLIARQVVDIATAIGHFVQNISLENDKSFPFAKELMPYFQQAYQSVDIKTAADQFQSALQVLASQLLNISFGLVNILLVFILTFFMTVEEKSLQEFYLSLFPSRYGHYISSRLEAIKEKIGYWLRGQLLLSLAATILSYIGLLILKVDYALTLSIIAGITMVIPVIGRIFALVITVPIVMSQSPFLALWVSIYYIILQQIETNILVPYIMNKAVGLSPIIIMFAMLVGSQYLGILGLVISIPIATTVAIFVKDYTEKAK